jgi:hypothetical protein
MFFKVVAAAAVAACVGIGIANWTGIWPAVRMVVVMMVLLAVQ